MRGATLPGLPHPHDEVVERLPAEGARERAVLLRVGRDPVGLVDDVVDDRIGVGAEVGEVLAVTAVDERHGARLVERDDAEVDRVEELVEHLLLAARLRQRRLHERGVLPQEGGLGPTALRPHVDGACDERDEHREHDEADEVGRVDRSRPEQEEPPHRRDRAGGADDREGAGEGARDPDDRQDHEEPDAGEGCELAQQDDARDVEERQDAAPVAVHRVPRHERRDAREHEEEGDTPDEDRLEVDLRLHDHGREDDDEDGAGDQQLGSEDPRRDPAAPAWTCGPISPRHGLQVSPGVIASRVPVLGPSELGARHS